MKQYRIKLTDENLQTGAGFIEKPFQWKVGQWRRKESERKSLPLMLCTGNVFHCYPKGIFLYSLILNYNHACIENPVVWLAQVAGKRTNKEPGLYGPSNTKEGYTRMRLVKRIELPKLTAKTLRKFCKSLGYAPRPELKTFKEMMTYTKNLGIHYQYSMLFIEDNLRIALGISKKRYDEMLKP